MPLYFAFGSNMDEAQMSRRCPGATALGWARLEDHRLVFRGPSRNRGGGMLSVDHSPGDTIVGVLYAVSEAHLAALDRYEGAPEWYLRAPRTVTDAQGVAQRAVVYRLPEHVVEMPPTQAYRDQVAAAYATLGLPEDPLQDACDRAGRA